MQDLGALDAREDLPRGLGVVSLAVEAQDDLVGPERCLAVPRAAIEADHAARDVQPVATGAALVDRVLARIAPRLRSHAYRLLSRIAPLERADAPPHAARHSHCSIVSRQRQQYSFSGAYEYSQK